MAITHSFTSAIPDGPDPTIVRPSNWNADHVIALSASDIPPLDYIGGAGVVGQVAEFVTDTKTLQAAKLIAPAVNILTITNAAASTLALAITSAKTLTLTATDNFNLTIPATGTVDLLGTAQTISATKTFTASQVFQNALSATFTNTNGARQFDIATTLSASGASALFPYVMIAQATTSGTTDFVTNSSITGLFGGVIIGAAINHQTISGLVGRIVFNNFAATVVNATAVEGRLTYSSTTPTVTDAIGLSALTIGTVKATNIYLIRALLTSLGGNQATNIYGLNISDIISTNFTNSYGIKIGNVQSATTLNYSIFTGTGLVNFGDQVKIDLVADKIGLIVQAHSTQTANLAEWQTSAAAVVVSITGTGTVKTSGRRQAIATKTADYTLTANDEVVVLTGTTARTFTLPSATATGQTFRICNESTAALTVDASGTQTIKGALTQTLYAGEDLIITDYASGVWA